MRKTNRIASGGASHIFVASPKVSLSASLGLCFLLVVACGGGSSGGGNPPTTNPPAPNPPVINPPANPGDGTLDSYYMTGGAWETAGNTVITGNYSSFNLANGIRLLNQHIAGPTPMTGPDTFALRVDAPPLDVRQAWRAGWTGLGTNILITDTFYVDTEVDMFCLGLGLCDGVAHHGYTVTLSAMQIAPRANYYSLQVPIDPDAQIYAYNGVRKMDTNALANRQAVDFHVINWSFGNDPSDTPLTADDIADDRETFSRWYDDASGSSYLPGTADAVITKAAGNETTEAGLVVDNLTLVRDTSTAPRTLIVGALNRYAQQGSASLASYSNTAGSLTDIQNRFLVEYGGSPYEENAYACPPSGMCPWIGDEGIDGTSFAAPRVAGHAALVRQKFPNLTGANTASILLDTATYNGLSCAPNCALSTYGQGRVDIGRALAPIGEMQ